jgi:large subunit ribosomal protein L22
MENTTKVTAVAKLRGCRMSARKMRLVADIVRGLPVEKAFGILKFTRKEAAGLMDKVLKSAVSNWTVITGQEPDEFNLKITTLLVDQGSQLKRFRPAPHGRAHRIRKHACHITLEVQNQTGLPTESTQDAEEIQFEEVSGQS